MLYGVNKTIYNYHYKQDDAHELNFSCEPIIENQTISQFNYSCFINDTAINDDTVIKSLNVTNLDPNNKTQYTIEYKGS